MLTVAIVLSLLVTSASADSPAEKPSEDLIMEQHEKNIELCTQNLVAIGVAIQAYRKKHGDFPDWLSDKDQGFDIIGISLDDAESELRDYIKENDIQWRQIFDNARGADSLVRQYGIRGIPAPWLIDRDGKLITHKARGEKLEQLVLEALKNKPANQ